MHDVNSTNQMNKMLKKGIGLLMIIIMATLGAMFGVSLAAGQALKESKVSKEEGTEPGTSVMETLSGEPVTVGLTEFSGTLFDLPTLGARELAHLSSVGGWVDLTTDPEVGGIHYFTGKPVAAYKNSTDLCFIETSAGHRLTVNGATRTASIKMNGLVHPFYYENPIDAATRRQLESRMKPRQLRRGGAFFGYTGSFTISSGNLAGNS